MSKLRNRPTERPLTPTTPQNGLSVSQVHAVQTTSRSGPIPDAAELAGYEQICSGAANRIIVMAEEEAIHRRTLEKNESEANIAAQREQIALHAKQTSAAVWSDFVGQFVGLLVMLAGIAATIYLAINNQPWVAGVVAGMPLAAIIQAIRNKSQK